MSPVTATCVICTLCILSITVVHSCEVTADQSAPDGCGLPGKLANFQGRSRTEFDQCRPTSTPGNKLFLGGCISHLSFARVVVSCCTKFQAPQGTSSATTTWWLESQALSRSCKRKFKHMTTSKRSVLAILGGSNSSAAARTAARSISC